MYRADIVFAAGETMSRAWYKNSCEIFLEENSESIIGTIVSNSALHGFEATPPQVQAWQEEIRILQQQIQWVDFAHMDIFLEFNIPRMGKRIDALLLIKSDKPHIIIFEFKAGADKVYSQDIDQVMGYALELKNFHEGSHGADVFPVVVATDSSDIVGESFKFKEAKEGIYEPVCINSDSIACLIRSIAYQRGDVSPEAWENSPYKPTPTIIEAARALYANHDVREITRSEGSAANIKATSEKLIEIVADAKDKHKKIIAFVTGVPGAGKTLVGLNLATAKRSETDETHAVFLSGNGPLVKVLKEALARDEVERNGGTLTDARAKVKSFIQNVHHYRDEYLEDTGAPSEHVAIFDEAQRAWNKKMTCDFMRRKKNRSDFDKSEPEFLISCLDRHDDWAAIICLVGGGQEINRGEAGISEWIDAIIEKFPHWSIAISEQLTDSEYAAGHAVELAKARPVEAVNGITETLPEMHLSVSMRSFRAESVSSFVKALLDIDSERAKIELAEIDERYPIRLTRNLAEAKKWIRKQALGSERPGVVASSKALRLKPFAIDVAGTIDPVHYFLGGKDDPRSSYFLEAAGSEFDVQGLELDYTIVSWDGDLRMDERACRWSHHDFRGHRWLNIKSIDNKEYQKNAYRVLLTRARQGMVIFIPLGNDPPDATRKSEFYDGTYNYLKSLGIRELVADIEDRGY